MTKATSNLPMLDTAQTATVTFDFCNMLDLGVTLIGTPTVLVTVAPTSVKPDASPGHVLLTTPRIGISPGSGRASQAVLIQIGTLLPGVTYVLQCYCPDSNGDTPSIYTHASATIPI